MKYNFDKVIDRRGTFSTQWDYIEDRFGEKDLLPFSISDTDFEIPNCVYEDLLISLNHKIFGYTRWNHDAFKEAICYHFQYRYHTAVNKHWILYSPSVIYSVSVLLRLKSKPMEGVLVFDPMYDAFIDVIQKNERKLISCPLDSNCNFSIDFDMLEKKLAEVKILLLCSPHNPTGKVFTKEELKKIVNLCKQHNVFIISDEIHSDMVLYGNKHYPILNFYGDYKHIALVSSASKTFNTPGLGGSYLLIPEQHLKEEFLIQSKQKDAVNSANIMGMIALISAYTKAQDYIDELVNYIEENMQILERFVLQNLPDIKFIKPQATYLAWLNIRNVPYPSKQVEKALVQIGKVGIMSGEVYGDNGKQFLRMNIGCPKEKLEVGLQRIKMAFDALYQGEIC